MESARLAAMPVGHLVCDAARRITSANSSAAALLGRDDLIGSDAVEVLRRIRAGPQDPSLPGDVPASRCRLLRGAGGGARAFLIHFDALQGHGGCEISFEPAQWSLGFLDQVSTGIATSDEGGVVVYANRALETLLGAKAADIVGVPVQRIAAAIAERPGDAQVVSDVAMGGGILTDTFIARLPGGSRAALHVRTTDWLYRGVPCGLIWSVDDQTEAEEARLQATAAFGHRLAALMQHELRNPLQTIQAAVDVLRPNSPPAAYRALGLIEQQVQLIGEFLAEQMQPPSPGSMMRRHLSDVVQAEIERSLIRLSTRLLRFRHEPLSCEPMVNVHAGAMGRAFANLFRNAAQARPDAQIDIRYAVHREGLVCTVTDDGPGFPPSVLAGRWLAPSAEGLEHLGLVIVTSTIEAHGGIVSLENGPEGGARITITLPVADRAGLWATAGDAGTG
ncbi:MAG TPA: PAS domain-containing sensor histidine kinase [Bacillota bacterium]|nr:PAS domain-containing sensor histidine kinase [Bacillota bacterium]